jgi:hypothetical protein
MTFPVDDPGIRSGRAKTGILRLRAVSKAAGQQEARTLKWGGFLSECGSRADDYYIGSFKRDRDSGLVVGCTHPVSGLFHGVFRSQQYGVEGGLEGTLGGPVAAGVFPARPGDVLTTGFRAHFALDGSGAEDSCPAPRRPTGASTSSARAATPSKIEETAEYKTFLGLCDAGPTPTLRAWGTWVQGQASDFVKRASGFAGAKSSDMFEEETSFGVHSARLVSGSVPTDFFTLLATDELPQDLWRRGNVFALASAVLEPKLREAIVRSKGGLLPADVVELALGVTGGNYPLAVVTAHDLLKNITKLGRHQIELAVLGRAKFKRDPEPFLRPLREYNTVVEKLASLRWKPEADKDKMGPWYHVFAVATGGALSWNAGEAREIVDLEHTAKKYNLFSGEGGHDVIKHQVDHCFAFAAGEEPLAKLSRFWDYSLFAKLFADVGIDDCLLGQVKFATN